MRYVLVRNAVLSDSGPEAELIAGEVICESDDVGKVLEHMPHPLRDDERLAKHLYEEGLPTVSAYEQELAELNDNIESSDDLNKLCDLLEFCSAEQLGLSQNHATLKQCLRRQIEVLRDTPEPKSISDIARLHQRLQHEYYLALGERLQDALRRTGEGDLKIRQLLQEAIGDIQVSMRDPDKVSVQEYLSELRSDKKVAFADHPAYGCEDRENWGVSYTILIRLTSREQAFQMLEADFRDQLSKSPSMSKNYWVEDFLRNFVERVTVFSDDGLSRDHISEELSQLIEDVFEMANLSDQENEWLNEDLMK